MRWLSYINVALVIILICVSGLFFFYSPKNELPTFLPPIERTELPKSPFIVSEDQDLGEGPFALNWVPPQMQLPDLKSELQFFGQNGRPDEVKGKASFHLALKSSGECHSVRERERVYLVYQSNFGPIDRTSHREPITSAQRPIWGDVLASPKGNYVFSPDNQPTPLWLEICSKGDRAVSLCVNMLDEKGILVKSPEEHRFITLQAVDFPKSQIIGWELGKYRVDSTLLVRQKARWIGPDRFLEMHGGDDFAYAIDKQRIDFLDEESSYSCFLGPHDFLIWKNERWTNPQPDESTEGYPLLAVKKIEDKIMTLELWDPEGRSKILLSLIRSRDLHNAPNLSQEFKFVGAKTWAQFIVECRNGERMTLKPYDWLVLTQDGWKKLDSPDLIDEFVEGELAGPLFILDKMTKQNGRQVLVGHLFNSSRTEVEEIELEAASTTSLANFYRAIPLSPPINTQLEGDEE